MSHTEFPSAAVLRDSSGSTFSVRLDRAADNTPTQRSTLSAKTSFKIVIVGDGAVGKTSVCQVFRDKVFPETYVVTVFDNYLVNIQFQDEEYELMLWDTAGQEDLKEVRKLAYSNTNIFLICFSLTNKESFENIINLWIPELNKTNPKATKIIVGTKSDLIGKRSTMRRLSHNTRYLSQAYQEIDRMIRTGKAHGYIECSAKQGNESIDPVFIKALNVHIHGPEPLIRRPRPCTVL